MWVSLLGPVSAETEAGPLPLAGRKQRAVFALLALQVNHPVALDRLVHEVWRDEPPAQSTLALQSYISRLRRTIADAHPDDEAAPRILTRPPGWVLVMPGEQVDAVRFTELAREGSALLDDGQTAAGAARLTEALGLWAGEALSDLDDMPFAAGEKARLDDARLEVTESLMWAELDLGRPASVATTARATVTRHPYRERAWCALMLALYRLGRQAEALETARELRETLAEGLGLDPSPEARLLQEQILAQDPALDLGRDRAPTVTLSPAVDRPEPPTPEASVLVGRDEVLERLDFVAGSAARGVGNFVVVEGSAGMGKSSVLSETAARLESAGGLVLRGGGVSAGASPALWPWVAILRRLVAERPDIVDEASSEGSAAALALLDPVVATTSTGGVAPLGADPVLARTRLYRAVVDLLARAHESQPLALIVDDAHWLDPDTLGLLSLAADELVPRGVVVVVALRSDEAPEVLAEIDSVAARLRTETVRLVLAGLRQDDIEELLHRSAPDEDHAQLAPALVARTGGNPLFVSELVRLLTSERRLDEVSVDTVLPQQVRDVLRRRLERLPERTQALLVVIALLSHPADVGLLTGVTGLDVEAVLDDAEAAVASSLLVEDPGSGGFVLSHDLVRQTLVETLSATRSARLHAKIAEVMQAEQRIEPTTLPETVVDIARHLVLAESVVGANAAIPYLVAVADDARTRSAFHLAERALRTALDLSQRVQDPERRSALELELRTRLALQSNVLSGQHGSGIFGDSAEPHAGGEPRVESDPLAWWGRQVQHTAEGRATLALAEAERAMKAELHDSTKAMVHSVLGHCHLLTGSLDLADQHLALAEEIGERVRDLSPDAMDPWLQSMLVSAPTMRSVAATLADNVPGAASHLARARERAGTSATELVLVEHHAAWEAAVRGDITEARDRAEPALALARQLGDSFWTPMAQLLVGWASAMGGDESGADVARAAYAECEAIGLRYQAPANLLLRAEAAARHGHLDEARSLVGQSRAMAELTGERTVTRRLHELAEDILTAGG